MTRYAAATDVSTAKSRAEIEAIVTRYGATGFMSGWTPDRATVAFVIENRHIKFTLPLPDREADEFKYSGHASPRLRSREQREEAYDQAVRQRWRALALVIKAKLEAVDAKIALLEDEFLAQIVLPDGKTVGEVMRQQIALAYHDGKMPPLLGYGG